MSKKNVALVLSSGGPRGFAYIGAIEELQSRGYTITSVSGCSVGSLVGGVFAAGKLEEFKHWLFSLDNFKVMSLMDLSISKSYLVKGEKVINAIKEVVPDVMIEDMAIPYVAVASDLYTGEQVIFREGKLFDAIRASISIPSMFKPVKYGHRTLVDGGIVNTLPLDLVRRSGDDILVGFDVNDVDTGSINDYLRSVEEAKTTRENSNRNTLELMNTAIHDSSMPLIDKVKIVGGLGSHYAKHYFTDTAQEKELETIADKLNIDSEPEDNYLSIISRCFSIANHVIAKLNAQTCLPDILVKMPFDEFSSISDYGRGREISDRGRELMAAALDRYESSDC